MRGGREIGERERDGDGGKTVNIGPFYDMNMGMKKKNQRKFMNEERFVKKKKKGGVVAAPT